MIIYQAYEIFSREFEAKMLLSIEAAKRGHTAVVADKNILTSIIKRGYVSSGIFHDKSIAPTPSRTKNIKAIKKLGFKITSIDEESGLLDDTYEKFARERFSVQNINNVEALFFWGKFDYEEFSRHYPGFAEKLFVTGNPRVDIWRADHAALRTLDDELIEKPYVLISSNASGIFDTRSFEKRSFEMLKMNLLQNDEQRNFWISQELHNIKLAASLVQMIDQLSMALPSIDFLVRPHPTESEDIWRMLLPKRDNIKVTKGGAVSTVIEHSICVVHNGCTSGVQAIAMGKPAFVLADFESEHTRIFPNRVSKPFLNVLDLIASIKCLPAIQRSHQEEIQSRFANLQGAPAASRIVDVWEQISNCDYTKKFKISMKLHLFLFFKYLISKTSRNKNNEKFKFNTNDLNKYLERFDAYCAFLEAPNVKYKVYYGRFIVIYNEV